jgi:hypothetical protein
MMPPVRGHERVVDGGTDLFFFENEKRLTRGFGKFHEPKDSIPGLDGDGGIP